MNFAVAVPAGPWQARQGDPGAISGPVVTVEPSWQALQPPYATGDDMATPSTEAVSGNTSGGRLANT
ncbi:MAG TPA: hypothetical protein VFL83_08235 [Anaeromyxobacter sp.]|nr:hypothetical protein [Anaeromyxobacter sp.]